MNIHLVQSQGSPPLEGHLSIGNLKNCDDGADLDGAGVLNPSLLSNEIIPPEPSPSRATDSNLHISDVNNGYSSQSAKGRILKIIYNSEYPLTASDISYKLNSNARSVAQHLRLLQIKKLIRGKPHDNLNGVMIWQK